MLRSDNYAPSIADLIRDYQYESTSFHLTQSTDSCEWLCNTSLPSSNDTDNEHKNIKENEYDEDSTDSSVHEQPPASLFKETSRCKWPWSKRSIVTGNYCLLNRVHSVKCTYIVSISRSKDITYNAPRRNIFVTKSQKNRSRQSIV